MVNVSGPCKRIRRGSYEADLACRLELSFGLLNGWSLLVSPGRRFLRSDFEAVRLALPERRFDMVSNGLLLRPPGDFVDRRVDRRLSRLLVFPELVLLGRFAMAPYRIIRILR